MGLVIVLSPGYAWASWLGTPLANPAPRVGDGTIEVLGMGETTARPLLPYPQEECGIAIGWVAYRGAPPESSIANKEYSPIAFLAQAPCGTPYDAAGNFLDVTLDPQRVADRGGAVVEVCIKAMVVMSSDPISVVTDGSPVCAEGPLHGIGHASIASFSRDGVVFDIFHGQGRALVYSEADQ